MGAKKDPKKDSKTPAKTPKKKEGGGGKAKKKKWSKGKSRDKLNNLVLFDKNTYDKLYKEVPSYKLITPSIVSERLKVKVDTELQRLPLTNFISGQGISGQACPGGDGRQGRCQARVCSQISDHLHQSDQGQ